LDDPDAHLHVTGFAAGDVTVRVDPDGLEARRRGEVYGSENYGTFASRAGRRERRTVTG
jgi:hypothetical protein